MYKAEEILVCKLLKRIQLFNYQPDLLETLQIIRKLMRQN